LKSIVVHVYSSAILTWCFTDKKSRSVHIKNEMTNTKQNDAHS